MGVYEGIFVAVLWLNFERAAEKFSCSSYRIFNCKHPSVLPTCTAIWWHVLSRGLERIPGAVQYPGVHDEEIQVTQNLSVRLFGWYWHIIGGEGGQVHGPEEATTHRSKREEAEIFQESKVGPLQVPDCHIWYFCHLSSNHLLACIGRSSWTDRFIFPIWLLPWCWFYGHCITNHNSFIYNCIMLCWTLLSTHDDHAMMDTGAPP